MENRMLFNLDTLVKKYNIHIDGVIHVGGHIGEEIPLYKKYTNNIHVFEPQKDCFDKIENSVQKYCVALGSKKEVKTFFVANNNQSSSLLEPKEHLNQHPEVLFNKTVEIQVETLDSFNIKNCSFMNLDVQGYELEVLKGSNNTLEQINHIYTEINTKYLYKDCVLLDELDAWLDQKGFIRVELSMCMHFDWGDALYIRKNK